MIDTIVSPTGQPWRFDDAVTASFDDMLARSIPQYDVMRRAVTDVGASFLRDGDWILDLGASRGEAVAPFVHDLGAHNRFVLAETSPPMLAVLRERFRALIDAGVVDVRDVDLRRSFPPVEGRCGLVLAVLTLQFIPIEHRARVVADCRRALRPGGAMVVVEKVIGSTAAVDHRLVSLYRALKVEHGYSQEQVERKALALEGVLVPMTARWNEEMLRAEGFRVVECFWRWMNFAAWVAA